MARRDKGPCQPTLPLLLAEEDVSRDGTSRVSARVSPTYAKDYTTDLFFLFLVDFSLLSCTYLLSGRDSPLP